MAAVILCWTLLTVGLLGSASEALENVSAHSGGNIVLPCQATESSSQPIILEWSRSDHDKLEYVFLYRDGQFDPENQHPSFKNRVELRDKQMKNGDLSLILIDVTADDIGTYECRVVRARSNLPTPPINVINLKVTNNGQDLRFKFWQSIIGGQKDGKVLEYLGLMLYQIVFLLFLLL
ncbi:coxsackievirus and adenovirus receptor homolog [Betta splendens]|uniref:Coxsackievirus and adenovirus receptor homolog n=1 Tax=Betta splendens TaxID=158456 RepID=A0A6P7N570_BETSP|nr:coxsackievirus and adenovirus receptor homolog [Betta splendens]